MTAQALQDIELLGDPVHAVQPYGNEVVNPALQAKHNELLYNLVYVVHVAQVY